MPKKDSHCYKIPAVHLGVGPRIICNGQVKIPVVTEDIEQVTCLVCKGKYARGIRINTVRPKIESRGTLS